MSFDFIVNSTRTHKRHSDCYNHNRSLQAIARSPSLLRFALNLFLSVQAVSLFYWNNLNHNLSFNLSSKKGGDIERICLNILVYEVAFTIIEPATIDTYTKLNRNK